MYCTSFENSNNFLKGLLDDGLQLQFMGLHSYTLHTLLPQVDVLFPSTPLFTYNYPLGVTLMLKPILDYANNDTKKYGLYTPYNLSWAPHHLGKWPSALKQTLVHTDEHS